MTRWKLLISCCLAMGASDCVATHQERVALRMGWPPAPPAALIAYAPPNADYPSVGGDILKAALPPTR
ncbi:MAG TPA: hypothetical protein VII73_04825 [Caulobacteraceae bacterium]